ncbi:MAG: hypothetical protein HGB19_10250 [Chlorobiales bacterium]|nr:hypothetical protein [Chlorobiales bacterium]
MEFNTPKEKITHYIDKGIIQDISLARLSYSLLMSTGRNGKKSETTRYRQLFEDLQRVLSDHVILNITKLFEKPNSRYEIISLPTTLQVIVENIANLDIVERPLVGQQLHGLGIDVPQPWTLPPVELSQVIVKYFANTLESLENSTTLEALRVLRNKRIAHRELIDISGSPTTTFCDAFELIKFAQNFVIVAGTAYTSVLHGFVNEDFFLGEDAERGSRAMDHLVDTVLKS